MQDLTTNKGESSAINLLSMFLDKYEGKRINVKPEDPRLAHLRPFRIVVNNVLDPENIEKTEVFMSFFHTLGHLRETVANKLGVQVNEFHMILQKQIIDPELNDT